MSSEHQTIPFFFFKGNNSISKKKKNQKREKNLILKLETHYFLLGGPLILYLFPSQQVSGLGFSFPEE